jgi:hypothetical protein
VPNDAKLGLAAGVAIVLLVAVVFYRSEAGLSLPLSAGSGVAAEESTRANRSAASYEQAPRAKPSVQIEGSQPAAMPSRPAKELPEEPVE